MLKVVDPAAASIASTQAENASEPAEPELMEQGRLEFIELALAYQDGALAGADLRAFESSLCASAQKRKLFVDLQIFSQRIREVLQRQAARGQAGELLRPGSDPVSSFFFPESPQPEISALPPLKTERPSMAAAAAILLAAAAILFAIYFKPAANFSKPAAAMAYLTQTADAQWSSSPPREHAILTPGQFRINSGSASIEFFSGARLIVEGPAEFQLLSAQRVFCRTGRFTANIPRQARGFQIETPRLNAIAGGASFGLSIERGIAELHVFEGSIQWQRRAGALQSLLEGDAVALDPASHARHFLAHPAQFVSEAALAKRTAHFASERLSAWRAAGLRLNEDPALLARFDFENRLAENHAVDFPADSIALVGCEWSRGRFPGKTAIEFNRPGDHVGLSIGASPKSLTLLAWVKIDTLIPASRTLFSSGTASWEITPAGCLHFEMSDPMRSLMQSRTAIVFTPSHLGQWTLLALVFDADAQELVHYLDGAPIAREPFAPRAALALGAAALGNRAGLNAPPSPLMGRMDEFTLVSRPFTSSEVRAIYEAGRP